MTDDAQALLQVVAPDPLAWESRADATYVYFRIQAYVVAYCWARCKRVYGWRAADAFYQPPVQHAMRVHAAQLALEALHGASLANFYCDSRDLQSAPAYEPPTAFTREHPLHWEKPCEITSKQRQALAELCRRFRDGSWVRDNKRRTNVPAR